jgi:integrase/recombinase XerD
LTEQFTIREMLEMVLGTEGKRKLRLRHKGNEELFSLYDSQLVLKHSSQDALGEAKRVLGHFRDFLGGYPPSPELAVGFLAQFKGRKPATLYRYAAILKGFMAWYGEKLELRIRVPQSLPQYVEGEEIERLKAALKEKQTHKGVIERNLLLIELATKTGLRRGEIANLRVGDIDLYRQCLAVRLGKGLKDRVVDLTPSLAQSLEVFIKGKAREEKVFGLEPSTISGIIRRAAKKARLPIHTHSLRDFFATRLVDEGVDLEIIRRLLGHTNLNVTRRYLARTDSQRREAINRLERPQEAIELPGGDGRHGEDAGVSQAPFTEARHSWELVKHEQGAKRRLSPDLEQALAKAERVPEGDPRLSSY